MVSYNTIRGVLIVFCIPQLLVDETSLFIASALATTSRACALQVARMRYARYARYALKSQRDNKNGERFAVVSKGVFDSLNLP